MQNTRQCRAAIPEIPPTGRCQAKTRAGAKIGPNPHSFAFCLFFPSTIRGCHVCGRVDGKHQRATVNFCLREMTNSRHFAAAIPEIPPTGRCQAKTRPGAKIGPNPHSFAFCLFFPSTIRGCHVCGRVDGKHQRATVNFCLREMTNSRHFAAAIPEIPPTGRCQAKTRPGAKIGPNPHSFAFCLFFPSTIRGCHVCGRVDGKHQRATVNFCLREMTNSRHFAAAIPEIPPTGRCQAKTRPGAKIGPNPHSFAFCLFFPSTIRGCHVCGRVDGKHQRATVNFCLREMTNSRHFAAAIPEIPPTGRCQAKTRPGAKIGPNPHSFAFCLFFPSTIRGCHVCGRVDGKHQRATVNFCLREMTNSRHFAAAIPEIPPTGRCQAKTRPGAKIGPNPHSFAFCLFFPSTIRGCHVCGRVDGKHQRATVNFCLREMTNSRHFAAAIPEIPPTGRCQAKTRPGAKIGPNPHSFAFCLFFPSTIRGCHVCGRVDGKHQRATVNFCLREMTNSRHFAAAIPEIPPTGRCQAKTRPGAKIGPNPHSFAFCLFFPSTIRGCHVCGRVDGKHQRATVNFCLREMTNSRHFAAAIPEIPPTGRCQAKTRPGAEIGPNPHSFAFCLFFPSTIRGCHVCGRVDGKHQRATVNFCLREMTNPRHFAAAIPEIPPTGRCQAKTRPGAKIGPNPHSFAFCLFFPSTIRGCHVCGRVDGKHQRATVNFCLREMTNSRHFAAAIPEIPPTGRCQAKTRPGAKIGPNPHSFAFCLFFPSTIRGCHVCGRVDGKHQRATVNFCLREMTNSRHFAAAIPEIPPTGRCQAKTRPGAEIGPNPHSFAFCLFFPSTIRGCHVCGRVDGKHQRATVNFCLREMTNPRHFAAAIPEIPPTGRCQAKTRPGAKIGPNPHSFAFCLFFPSTIRGCHVCGRVDGKHQRATVNFCLREMTNSRHFAAAIPEIPPTGRCQAKTRPGAEIGPNPHSFAFCLFFPSTIRGCHVCGRVDGKHQRATVNFCLREMTNPRHFAAAIPEIPPTGRCQAKTRPGAKIGPNPHSFAFCLFFPSTIRGCHVCGRVDGKHQRATVNFCLREMTNSRHFAAAIPEIPPTGRCQAKTRPGAEIGPNPHSFAFCLFFPSTIRGCHVCGRVDGKHQRATVNFCLREMTNPRHFAAAIPEIPPTGRCQAKTRPGAKIGPNPHSFAFCLFFPSTIRGCHVCGRVDGKHQRATVNFCLREMTNSRHFAAAIPEIPPTGRCQAKTRGGAKIGPNPHSFAFCLFFPSTIRGCHVCGPVDGQHMRAMVNFCLRVLTNSGHCPAAIPDAPPTGRCQAKTRAGAKIGPNPHSFAFCLFFPSTIRGGHVCGRVDGKHQRATVNFCLREMTNPRHFAAAIPEIPPTGRCQANTRPGAKIGPNPHSFAFCLFFPSTLRGGHAC